MRDPCESIAGIYEAQYATDSRSDSNRPDGDRVQGYLLVQLDHLAGVVRLPLETEAEGARHLLVLLEDREPEAVRERRPLRAAIRLDWGDTAAVLLVARAPSVAAAGDFRAEAHKSLGRIRLAELVAQAAGNGAGAGLVHPPHPPQALRDVRSRTGEVEVLRGVGRREGLNGEIPRCELLRRNAVAPRRAGPTPRSRCRAHPLPSLAPQLVTDGAVQEPEVLLIRGAQWRHATRPRHRRCAHLCPRKVRCYLALHRRRVLQERAALGVIHRARGGLIRADRPCEEGQERSEAQRHGGG
mmetsp:Transcript_75492/g.219285  ORF Transcript_75492/g.219285 Transcript_75492/m.219285 type:complete len:298 (-) Transcript_75492:94-987(-)